MLTTTEVTPGAGTPRSRQWGGASSCSCLRSPCGCGPRSSSRQRRFHCAI